MNFKRNYCKCTPFSTDTCNLISRHELLRGLLLIQHDLPTIIF